MRAGRRASLFLAFSSHWLLNTAGESRLPGGSGPPPCGARRQRLAKQRRESTARLGLQRGGGHGGAEAARVAALRGAARRDWLQRKPPGANGVRASVARARQHRRGVGRRRAAQAAAGAGVHACGAAEPCAASPQICGAAAWLRRSPARRSGSRRLSWRGRRSSRQPGAACAPCAARRCCTEDPSCERLRRRRLHGARRDRRGRGQGRAAGQGCATWATARTSSSAFGRHAIEDRAGLAAGGAHLAEMQAAHPGRV